MRSVAIIGTGRLGVRLAENLITSPACEEVQLWNRSPGKLESAVLSLSVFGAVVNSRCRITSLDWPRIQGVDVVVIAVKDSYDPREMMANEMFPSWYPKDVRTVGIRRDAPLVRSVCNKLQRYRGIVVVITNPLDVMTTLVRGFLPAAQVLGLGVSLDSARLAYVLSGIGRKRVGLRDVPVGGEHGGALVPLRSLWGQAGKRQLAFPRNMVKDAIVASKAIGPRIVSGLGYTLQDVVAVFSRDIESILERQRREDVLLASWGDERFCVGRALTFDAQRGMFRESEGTRKLEKRLIDRVGESIHVTVERLRKSDLLGL